MNYGVWLNTWLDLYVRPTYKAKSYEKYEQLVRLHIIPKLGDLEMSELSVMTLQRFIVEQSASGNIMSKKGMAANSVNGLITVLQRSLQAAVNTGEIKKHCAYELVRPKTEEKAIECLSVKEQRALENYVLCNYKRKPKLFGVVLCLYTGMRIGELLALEWSDIDWQNARISINKTVCYGKGKDGRIERFIDVPKTANSKRLIPIPKAIIPHLKKAKRLSGGTKYVISQSGEPVSNRSYQRTFELLLKKLGIIHRGFHALRHTFATRALECGMDVKTLSEILGHKNTVVTLNRYVHSLMEHKTEMMNRLGKQLFVGLKN